jgi:two-component system, NarL family, invasion response regulator UvrY
LKDNLRILIADDHPIIRKGIQQLIVEEFANAEIGEANDADELLALARSQQWDIIVTDISMPGGGELDSLKQLRLENPELPILVLSMLAEEMYGKRALKAGASGYLGKESAPEELGNAIRIVLSGKKYISPKVAQLLAEEAIHGKKNVPFHELLSDREMEVFKMIASGKTVSEIAEILSLSVPTISTYRMRTLEKLNLRNNSDLTHFAFSNGII